MDSQNTLILDSIQKGESDFLASIQSFAKFDPTYTRNNSAVKLLTECVQSLAKPYSPWTYLAYYNLGNWLISKDPKQEGPVSKLVSDAKDAAFKSTNTPQPDGNVCVFGDTKIASSSLWQAALRLFQEGGDFIADLDVPKQSLIEHWTQEVPRARSLIRRVDRELVNLMDQIQNLLIIAEPGPIARAIPESFGGATCFFFRGATVINASRQQSIVEIVEKLVHEYAHAELFVLGQDQPLCLNNDDEKHKVLIRNDPRPMNGIMHSLYVTGRVGELLDKLLSDGLNDIPQRETILTEARELLKQQIRFGKSSLAQVKKHAALTTIGNSVVTASERRLANAEKV